MPNLFLPLDVQCSMLDVRRFRADLWMKSFLKYWLPVLAWLAVTFIGSTNVMSVEHTSRFIVPFLLWLKPGMTQQNIWVIIVFMRHCAHVGEYAVLAFLMWRALRWGHKRVHADADSVWCSSSWGVPCLPRATNFTKRLLVAYSVSSRRASRCYRSLPWTVDCRDFCESAA